MRRWIQIGDTIPFACRFSDDGQHLAHAVLDTISIYDAASGALLTRQRRGRPDDLEGRSFLTVIIPAQVGLITVQRAIFPLCGGDLGMPAFISAVQSTASIARHRRSWRTRAFISPYGFLAVQSAAAFAARCAGSWRPPLKISNGHNRKCRRRVLRRRSNADAVLVRNARGAIVSRMNTRGCRLCGAERWRLPPPARLRIVDARQELLINRMPLIACIYCNAIGPFGDGTMASPIPAMAARAS